MWRKLLLTCAVLLLAAVIAGCGSKVCEVDSDCQRAHFSGRCIDNNCSYIPIPNECGNDRCEAGAGENKCTCAQDCGFCEGSVPGAPSMQLACDATQQCSSDLDPSTQSLRTHASTELRGAGGSFRIESSLPDPFNVKRDEMQVLVYLTSASLGASEHRVERIDLEARGEDNRIVPIASVPVDRPLFGEGRENGITVPVRFEFATGLAQEHIRDISMNLRYSFTQVSGSSSQVIEPVPLRNLLRSVEIDYVVPTATYACPDSCDDGNPGTLDVCDESTDFFCEHRPRAGVCGNFVCEGSENRCTCEVDCGVCADETQFLTYACEEAQCLAKVKSGIEQSSQTIGPIEFGQSGFKVRGTFTYTDPFIVEDDRVEAAFELVQTDPAVSGITIKEIRASAGGVLLGRSTQAVVLDQVGTLATVQVPLDLIADAESELVVTLEGDYEYTRAGSLQPLAKFRRTLNKGAFLNP